MTKRMLIDATHAEETRVVVLDSNRLEDFDVETSTKRQLKGNIYLAKVVRVEPSLQAAFVEYGGNRHGFLAFGEIHPDYYQIPIADRQRLLEMQAEEARREQEEDDRAATAGGHDDDGDNGGAAPSSDAAPGSDAEPTAVSAPDPDSDLAPEVVPEVLGGPDPDRTDTSGEPDPAGEGRVEFAPDSEIGGADEPAPLAGPRPAQPAAIAADVLRGTIESGDEPTSEDRDATPQMPGASQEIEQSGQVEPGALGSSAGSFALTEETDPAETATEAPAPETVGGENDGGEDTSERRIPSRFLRNYKIQEVIRRRQILLVQVVKEERGTKGAALTTYLSLAGRYCVLMPNSPRGGGISRKITSMADRRRLKEATAELDLPKGMGLIVRTAGANRPKPEIKRDCEYLLRLWDDIREHTLRSVAPAQIYEEASLIKRSIRDVYSRDVDELMVDGEEGWRAARDFMRMLMPSHAKKVQLWREPQPLFARFQVDAQLDAMLMPTVQLRSGGYLVINQTEALVAIDVNSGRSTRERGIEETALRTNLEAADEVARQLRLRDLAGLVVIDFIDMESRKHNGLVEKRLKEALKADRARIQLGQISHFGLLEMSRQRLRPSLAETSFIPCPHCGGLGHVRSIESAAIHVLRGIEEEATKRRATEVVVHVALPIAMYILNHKRDRLGDIEQRYAMRVSFAGDDTLISPQFRIERVRALVPSDVPVAVRPEAGQAVPWTDSEPVDAEADETEADETEAEEAGVEEAEVEEANAGVEPAEGQVNGAPAGEAESAEEGERRRKRRRRRRRGGRPQEAGAVEDADMEEAAETIVAQATNMPAANAADVISAAPGESATAGMHVEGVPEHGEPAEAEAGTTGPAPAATGNAGSGSAEDDGRNRRRGRRGRSRRRGDETLPEIAALGAEQPDLPPVYAGPTPANPFGGTAFDIFDALEQAENQATAAPAPALPLMVEPAVTPEPVPDIDPEPAATTMGSRAAEPALPITLAEEIVAAENPDASLAAAPTEAVPEPEAVPSPDEAPVPANDEAAAEPALKPILVGQDDTAPAQRRLGWWRR